MAAHVRLERIARPLAPKIYATAAPQQAPAGPVLG